MKLSVWFCHSGLGQKGGGVTLVQGGVGGRDVWFG